MSAVQELSGKFKFYDEAKGYGFMTTDSGDVFVHAKVFRKAGFETPKDIVKNTPFMVKIEQNGSKLRGVEIVKVTEEASV